MLNYDINKKEIKQIYNYVKNNKILFNKDCIEYLDKIIKDKETLFCSISTLKNIIDTTLLCNKNMNSISYIEIAQKLYELNVSLIATEDELKNFFNIYKLVIDLENYNHINMNKFFLEDVNFIYNSFENKTLVRIIFNKIESLSMNKAESITMFYSLRNYLSNSHMFYSDEMVYISSINNFLENIKPHINHDDKIEELMNNQLNFDKKIAGIYDVDENKMQKLEEKIIELESRLEGLKKNADQNSDSYKQVEEEAKKLLGDISKFKVSETKKVFKIAGISEEAERKVLLQKAKRYDRNFQLRTNDTRWFCQEVIDKLGIEFIVKSSQSFICDIYKKGLINELSDILKINPNFCLESSEWFDEEIIEMFDLELIAAKFNENVQDFISYNFNKKQRSLLKKIIDINPNFITQIATLERVPYINVEITDLEYIAHIDIDRVKTCEYFSSCNKTSKLADILKTNNTFFINDYIGCIDNYNSVYLKNEIIKCIIDKLDIHEIIKMFDNNSMNYKKLCNCLIIASSMNFDYESLAYSLLALSEEYKEQIFSISNLEQDDISNLNGIQKKEIIREMQKILRNYSKEQKRKKLIFKRGKK